MHTSALDSARQFFDAYVGSRRIKIVDIGARDTNGSLRPLAPPGSTYIGVDQIRGKNVDMVIDDPYALPFGANSVDVCVSTSCFEHVEMFWVLFLEILRILKPTGLFYLNSPSSGRAHSYPVDCWRFYLDSAEALVKWGKRNGYAPAVLECFINEEIAMGARANHWHDLVAVFIKDESEANRYQHRMREHWV